MRRFQVSAPAHTSATRLKRYLLVYQVPPLPGCTPKALRPCILTPSPSRSFFCLSQISALARVSQAFSSSPPSEESLAYLGAATKAAEFVRENLYRSGSGDGETAGTLLRSWRNGRASPVSFAVSYSTFFVLLFFFFFFTQFHLGWLPLER